MMRNQWSRVASSWIVLAGLACSQAEEPPAGEEIPFNRGTAQSGPQNGGLEFRMPEGWVREQPSSAMRHSQYLLPGEEAGKDAELAVFTNIGGSIRQNVDRWINQFTIDDGRSASEAAEVSTKEIHGFKVTLVDVSGSYNAAMGPMAAGGGETRPGYRMLAAVIETPQAPWFLKLTGPRETVARWEASFEQFVESAHPGGRP